MEKQTKPEPPHIRGMITFLLNPHMMLHVAHFRIKTVVSYQRTQLQGFKFFDEADKLIWEIGFII